ncbi:SecY-interacting protein [Aestuariibacter salexigens]|uniref:SecY-interacting protein n=1 Tax=Aestuariibacter salexigens TaxID=226010 RepID=UPI0003F5620D|nr:SecY-interacting protein [Aestuariibacter salexigens]
MPNSIDQALDNLFDMFLSTAPESSRLVEFDPKWPSPCYQSKGKTGEHVIWTPVLCEPSLRLSNVEAGMDIQLHDDLHRYFGRYFSDNLDLQTERGNLQLLFAWNESDFDRLQQNIIGHLLMKQRLEQPPTVFFAVTDEEDFILTVDNENGAVMLEQVGLPPTEQLAPDLATFIGSLTLPEQKIIDLSL